MWHIQPLTRHSPTTARAGALSPSFRMESHERTKSQQKMSPPSYSIQGFAQQPRSISG